MGDEKDTGKQISMICRIRNLNPLFTIEDQVAEPMRIHSKLDKLSAREKVKNMLQLVKIPSPEIRLREYPHQMSGGMRQRIVGAMVLSCEPKLLIADEPTTSLDVTVQAQFLNLLKDIQQKSNLSMIMVTHDFGIVAKVCDKVAVMYAGKIVESAGTRELFNNPKHPYTIALINCLPKIAEDVDRLYSIEGQPPNIYNLPPGCGFEPRCPEAMEICRQKYPEQFETGKDHYVRCWLMAREYNR